jgi:hypothetical protein
MYFARWAVERDARISTDVLGGKVGPYIDLLFFGSFGSLGHVLFSFGFAYSRIRYAL